MRIEPASISIDQPKAPDVFCEELKPFGSGIFFLFLVAVPRPTHTAMLALSNTVNWMVNNDDFFGL